MAIRRSPLCGIAVEAESVSSSRLWNTLRWTDSCTTPDFPINQISKRLNPAGQILCFSMEQDPVHQLVLRALRGSEVVVANSATIPKAGVPNFDSSAWEAFEEITLVPAVVRARKA